MGSSPRKSLCLRKVLSTKKCLSLRKSLCPRKVLSTKKCLSSRKCLSIGKCLSMEKCLSTGNSQITSKFVDHGARAGFTGRRGECLTVQLEGRVKRERFCVI